MRCSAFRKNSPLRQSDPFRTVFIFELQLNGISCCCQPEKRVHGRLSFQQQLRLSGQRQIRNDPVLLTAAPADRKVAVFAVLALEVCVAVFVDASAADVITKSVMDLLQCTHDSIRPFYPHAKAAFCLPLHLTLSDVYFVASCLNRHIFPVRSIEKGALHSPVIR